MSEKRTTVDTAVQTDDHVQTTAQTTSKQPRAPFIVLKLTDSADMWTQVFVIGKTRSQVLGYASENKKYNTWIRELMCQTVYNDLTKTIECMQMLGYKPVMLL